MEISAILTYLQANPNALLLIIGVVSGILILAVLILTSVFGKVIDIAIGPLKFSTSNNKKECPNGEVCKKIQNAIEFYNYEDKSKSLVETIVSETLKLAEEKDRLFFKESITHIMMIAEEFNVKIRSIFTEQYFNELKGMLQPTEDVKTHRDYKYFQVLINTVLDELKRSSLKQSIEASNISEMSDSEFSMFCNQKTDMMFLIIVEYLDLMYNINSVVSRDQMRKIVTSLQEKVVILYKEMYRAIRVVKIEDDTTIEGMKLEIKSNAENLRAKMIGEDPVSKIKKTLDTYMKG